MLMNGIVLTFVLILSSAAIADVDKWSIYSSDNFVIYSDARKGKVRKLIEKLEVFDYVVRTATNMNVAGDQKRMRIYLFDHSKDFTTFSTVPNVAGLYLPTYLGKIILLQEGNSSVSTQHILFHEYVHHLINQSGGPSYPLWFEEGMAELLGATQLKRRHAVVGAVPKARALDLVHSFDLPVANLLEPSISRSNELYWTGFYAKAWQLVHFLHMDVENGVVLKSKLDEYMRFLEDGKSPKNAFEWGFEISTDEVDRLLDKYKKQRRLGAIRIDIPKKEYEVSITKLSLNESIAELASVAALIENKQLALSILEQLDTIKPDSARGQSLRAVLIGDSDLVEARKARRAALEFSPEDPVVLRNVAKYDLAEYQKPQTDLAFLDGSKLQSIEERLNLSESIDPNCIETYRLLWQVAMERDDSVEAAKMMMAAYGLDRTNVVLNIEIGLFLLEEDKPKLALSFLEDAQRLAHDKLQKESIGVILATAKKMIRLQKH
ncbi:hypothetical protein [Aurantivibrio plasticivorans]